jgi:hypothetical protein
VRRHVKVVDGLDRRSGPQLKFQYSNGVISSIIDGVELDPILR